MTKSAGINLQSPQSDSTPWILTLVFLLVILGPIDDQEVGRVQELDILLLCVQLLLPAPTALHCTTSAAWALCLYNLGYEVFIFKAFLISIYDD